MVYRLCGIVSRELAGGEAIMKKKERIYEIEAAMEEQRESSGVTVSHKDSEKETNQLLHLCCFYIDIQNRKEALLKDKNRFRLKPVS